MSNNVFNANEYLQEKNDEHPFIIDEGISSCCSSRCLDMNQQPDEKGVLYSLCMSCREWCETLFETNNGENKN